MKQNNTKKILQRSLDGKKTILITAGFALLTMAGFVLKPGASASGLLISIGFSLLWSVLVGLAVSSGQWIPLLAGSLYLTIPSAMDLYVNNAIASERAVPLWLEQLTAYGRSAFQGFSFVHESLQFIVPAVLTLLTLIGLIVVLDKNKPTIIDDQDPIDL